MIEARDFIKFRMCFDNIDEPIIFFSDEKAEYVNDSFLRLFKNCFKETQNPSVTCTTEDLSLLQKVNRFLRQNKNSGQTNLST